MKQEAVVTVFGLSFSSYCEKLITETYEANAKKVNICFVLLFIWQLKYTAKNVRG